MKLWDRLWVRGATAVRVDREEVWVPVWLVDDSELCEGLTVWTQLLVGDGVRDVVWDQGFSERIPSGWLPKVPNHSSFSRNRHCTPVYSAPSPSPI